jgi:hypothetical protein
MVNILDKEGRKFNGCGDSFCAINPYQPGTHLECRCKRSLLMTYIWAQRKYIEAQNKREDTDGK